MRMVIGGGASSTAARSRARREEVPPGRGGREEVQSTVPRTSQTAPVAGDPAVLVLEVVEVRGLPLYVPQFPEIARARRNARQAP
jgi:hypothetical protein